MLMRLIVTAGCARGVELRSHRVLRLGTLRRGINELQAQALSQEKERCSKRARLVLSVPRLTLDREHGLDLRPRERATPDQLDDFGRRSFDAVVRIANQQLTGAGDRLEAVRRASREPAIRAELLQYMEKTRELTRTRTRLLLVPAGASQESFRGR